MRFSYALSLLAYAGAVYSQSSTSSMMTATMETSSMAPSPTPSPGGSTNSTKPSIVLVHGALADGSSWSGVIPLLQARNYTNVWAVQQPLSSVANDTAKVMEALDWIPAPIVLVGHSFGGIVITDAGNHKSVKALVYVAAFAPDQNQTVLDFYPGNKNNGTTTTSSIMTPTSTASVTGSAFGHNVGPLTNHNNTSIPANITMPESSKHFKLDAQGRFYLEPADFVKYFAPDVPHPKAMTLAAVQGLTDTARFNYTSGKTPAWKHKPSYVVVAGNDQIISPELEKWQAMHIGAKKTITVNNSSHAVLVSQPRRVAAMIMEAADAVAKNMTDGHTSTTTATTTTVATTMTSIYTTTSA